MILQTLCSPNEDFERQPNTSHDIAHVCFVSPSLQYRYKENIRRSSCLLACCVLCIVSPSFQCCYIRRSSRMLGVSKSSHSPSSLEWGHDTSKSDRYTPTPFDPLSVHLVGFSRWHLVRPLVPGIARHHVKRVGLDVQVLDVALMPKGHDPTTSQRKTPNHRSIPGGVDVLRNALSGLVVVDYALVWIVMGIGESSAGAKVDKHLPQPHQTWRDVLANGPHFSRRIVVRKPIVLDFSRCGRFGDWLPRLLVQFGDDLLAIDPHIGQIKQSSHGHVGIWMET